MSRSRRRCASFQWAICFWLIYRADEGFVSKGDGEYSKEKAAGRDGEVHYEGDHERPERGLGFSLLLRQVVNAEGLFIYFGNYQDPDKTSHSFRFDLIEDLRAYRHALEDWALVVFGVVSRPARSPEGRKELLDGMYELTHKAACSLS